MTRRFTAIASDPAYARELVRSHLTGVAPEVIENAQTIVSELVTNAIVHGPGEASLVIEVRESCLHVEVLDAGPAVEIEPLTVEPSSVRGRGLTIVDCLASSWGVERRRVGKSVWFDLNL